MFIIPKLLLSPNSFEHFKRKVNSSHYTYVLEDEDTVMIEFNEITPVTLYTIFAAGMSLGESKAK